MVQQVLFKCHSGGTYVADSRPVAWRIYVWTMGSNQVENKIFLVAKAFGSAT
jgi:hypothetical protein